MDFMPEVLEFTGQVIDVNPLPTAEHITAVGKEAYFHQSPPGDDCDTI